MNKYNLFFGIEIHIELNTKTKAFSTSKVSFNDEPNTNISPFDVGYPGSKPLPNKKMIEYAYRLGKVLNMEIAKTISFDRKNYFYPDLAPGFQITQFHNPIGKNGIFKIKLENKDEKEIKITQIQMEQDTAKQIIKNGERLFDFNRAGIPLIEVISGHEDLKNIDEVIEYLKTLREQVIILGISKANMHKGEFRVDVNVSISKDENPGERVEIKNLNSFSNIRKALEKEIELQKELIELGKKVEFVTKRFDEEKQTVIEMRSKDSNSKYNFFPEGNINPIIFSEKLKREFDKFEIHNIFDVKNVVLNYFNDEDKTILLNDVRKFNFFKEIERIKGITDFDPLKIMNLLKTAVFPNWNDEVYLSKTLKKVFILNQEKKITSSQTKDYIVRCISGEDIDDELSKIKVIKKYSKEEIKSIIIVLIESNPKTKEMLKNKPVVAEKFIIGQTMKETKGSANNQEVIKILNEILEEMKENEKI